MRRRIGLAILLVAAAVAPPLRLDAQQMRVVTGRVIATATGQPLPGVQVSVKGLSIGTLTDGQGTYSFRLPSNATTLVFTNLGYVTREVAVDDNLTVQMEQQAIGLEGIVVTALGVQREKRSLGYSVQAVSGADLNKVPEVNLVNALQGEVAGVHITNAGPTGGTSRIVIRGASSIAGSNQPLFIVDGIPVDNSAPGDGPGAGFGRNTGYGGIDYGNAVQDMDPNNIESISVLKGPNAAALYGSRAANGAVVITTKSGRTSRGFSFSTSITAENPLRLPDYQNLYGQGVGGEFQWVDGAGAGVYDFVDESWGPRMNGQPIDQFTGKGMPWEPHPDNIRSFFRTGLTSNTNLSFEQAGERGNVRLSLTNSIIEGMAPGESIDRIGVALKGGTDVTDRLKTEASLNYTSQEGKNRMGTGYDEDNPMQSFIWFGRQIDMNALKANYRCWEGSPTPCMDGGQYNWNYNYHNNPYWEQYVNTNGDQRDRLLGHVQATYQVNDWITATGRVGRDWYREHRKDVTAFNSLDDAGDGGFNEREIYRSETNADLIVSATRQLTSDFTLDLTVGGNVRSNDYETSNVGVSALTAPGIYTIDNASVAAIPGDYSEGKKVRSVYGSASLNYKGWFNVDATGRNDWSSTLPENNRSYFYPSVSSALVFSDALDISSDFFSSGKLRASWTRVGNDTDPYQLSSVFNAQTGFGSTPMFAVPNELPNADLKPEETTAYEIGADLGFF
ncbi:MAG TPA: SusC/RagA family TonB-linked outer membrane protein, partial [Longimicrobiales bacterium]|nr:SusC/RagA family TonB-linked outer membrane protein [Longimicrobiales bacterium]